MLTRVRAFCIDHLALFRLPDDQAAEEDRSRLVGMGILCGIGHALKITEELALMLRHVRTGDACFTIKSVSSPCMVNWAYRKNTHRWNNLWHPLLTFCSEDCEFPVQRNGSWCHQKDIALLWNLQVRSKSSSTHTRLKNVFPNSHGQLLIHRCSKHK